jgi:hypothetical protein
VTPKDLVFFLQEDYRIDAFREVDNGGIAGAHEPPFRTKVGIEGEDPATVGIRAHIQFVDQRVVVWEGTFEGQVHTCRTLDLLLFVFVVPVLVFLVDWIFY